MFFNRTTFCGYNPQSNSSSTNFSSSMFTQQSVSHSDTVRSNNYNSINFFRSGLLPPNYLEVNSHTNDRDSVSSTYTNRQPIMNPHQHFLTRTVDNCPRHLSSSKQNKWLKAGAKAQANNQLLTDLEHFLWSKSINDKPIHIHKFMSEMFLQGLIHKTTHVHLVCIDTECDKPTRENPSSVPAIIQIQVIFEEDWSNLFIVEVQHLPYRTSRLFQLIQIFCRQIFSSTNLIMGWGDVREELRKFVQFDLFDINQIDNTFNLQTYFTHYWNITHPHTPDCIDRHNQPVTELDSDDILVCYINSNDLDPDYDSSDYITDFDTCICPDTIRPYKKKNSIWSLQKAIKFVFNQALDKSMTMNFWSCGLDINLKTWRTPKDKHTRYSLIDYAINDVVATTKLYFHIQDNPTSLSSSSNLSSLPQINAIRPNVNQTLPTLLLLSDSHGKYFPPIANSTKYRFVTKSISGLQWCSPYDIDLSVSSIILSSQITSLLTSCFGVVFLVGTNSVRTMSAQQVIQQITELIDLLRIRYSHLTRKNRITIISTFPCIKPSTIYPTQSHLMSNINQYNSMLLELSMVKHFTVLTIPIDIEQLNPDGMHLHVQHVSFIYQFIQQTIDLLLSNSNTCRSTEAKARRNKKRHDKLRQRQASQSIFRPIAPVWKLQDVKDYLKFHNINYNRIPDISKHNMYLQFTHINDQQHADRRLRQDAFSTQNYHYWLSIKQ